MRGNERPVGSEFTNQNGYTYVKTEDRGWQSKQKLIAEANLGRELLPGERVFFKDGNRTNLDPANIGVRVVVDRRSPQGKLAAVEAEMAELKGRYADLKNVRDELRAQIANAKARVSVDS